MRLNSILLVFIIHASISCFLLSTESLRFVDYEDLFLSPAKQIVILSDTGFIGIMEYVPYLINSLLWSLIINYLIIFLNNVIRDKFN